MKEIETNDVFYRIEDGILFCSYKKHLIMDITVAKRVVDDRLKFTEGKSYPILIDFSNLKSADKEARDYMNSASGGLKGITCGAFIGSNSVATLFINLYLKINRPIIPTLFFTGKDEAIEWLKQTARK